MKQVEIYHKGRRSISQNFRKSKVVYTWTSIQLKVLETMENDRKLSKHDTFVLQTKRWKTIGYSLNSNVLTVNNKF